MGGLELSDFMSRISNIRVVYKSVWAVWGSGVFFCMPFFYLL